MQKFLFFIFLYILLRKSKISFAFFVHGPSELFDAISLRIFSVGPPPSQAKMAWVSQNGLGKPKCIVKRGRPITLAISELAEFCERIRNQGHEIYRNPL